MYLRTLWVPPPIMMEVLAAANDSDYLVVPLAILKIWPQLSPDKGMKDLDINERGGKPPKGAHPFGHPGVLGQEAFEDF